ncbi:MAG: hypothetical protein ACXWYF_10265 [Actinomycetota bacterium]
MGGQDATTRIAQVRTYLTLGKSLAPISELRAHAEASTMTQHEVERLNPFLRDAAVSFVPELTDDQLARIARAITALYPDTLVSRMTDFTTLVQGIPVEAETAQGANRVTWAMISREVREALVSPADVGTELTSIDVRLPAESMFDLN